MTELRRFSPSHLPLRARLTLWYLLTLAALLFLFLAFLYWQVQRNLIAQVDAALQLAATQALVGVDEANGRLAFQNNDALPALNRRLDDDFAIYLLSPAGGLWDSLGPGDEFSPQPPRPAAATIGDGDDQWRVYSEPIAPLAGRPAGWLQVAQEIEPVAETLAGLRAQILLGLPLALLLAGLGGFFLAGRALRPIRRITHTAQSIHGGDLSRRIGHAGPDDEIGRLAATFDNMLDRLQAAFARERRFTGDAAHELRTPLTALKGRLEVTLSRSRPAADYEATLRDMQSQVDRLIRLSNDLLFIARLEQGQQSLRRERIELAPLLESVVEQLTPLAAAKIITLTLRVPAGLALHGDLDLLIRLCLNLLDNALKYTPPGGRVAVTAHADNADAILTFSDSGPGIPAAHLPHLFDRFYRVEDDRARGPEHDGAGGAGLGLSIAGEIAQAHGGAITVASQIGQGTTFTVRLPLHHQNSRLSPRLDPQGPNALHYDKTKLTEDGVKNEDYRSRRR